MSKQPLSNKTETTEGRPQLYETIYLIRFGTAEAEIMRIVEVMRSVILDAQGIIVEEVAPRHRVLTYTIQKQSAALQGWIKFIIKPDKISAVKEKILSSKEIMRIMINKADEEGFKEQRPVIRKKRTQEEEKIHTEEIDKKLEEVLADIK